MRIRGVNQKAAQFESSKVFSQKFMERHGIPTAAAGTFDDVVAARKFAASPGKCVVRASDLARGKGVLICANAAEAERTVDEIKVGRAFGAASARVVIQGFLDGIAVSLLALCDGSTARVFPTSPDHKRTLDGAPETQVYLTRLENDLVKLLDASVNGTLSKMELGWSRLRQYVRHRGQCGLSSNLFQKAKSSPVSRPRCAATHESVLSWNRGEGRATRYQRRPCAWRDGLGQGYEKRANRRLRCGGENSV